jgi:hypothetical protein
MSELKDILQHLTTTLQDLQSSVRANTSLLQQQQQQPRRKRKHDPSDTISHAPPILAPYPLLTFATWIDKLEVTERDLHSLLEEQSIEEALLQCLDRMRNERSGMFDTASCYPLPLWINPEDQSLRVYSESCWKEFYATHVYMMCSRFQMGCFKHCLHMNNDGMKMAILRCAAHLEKNQSNSFVRRLRIRLVRFTKP